MTGQPIDIRLEVTAEVERALEGGPPVAVATVTDAGAGSVAAGTKMLVRADATVVGSLHPSIDDHIRDAATEQLVMLPRVTAQALWVNAGRGATDRRSQAAEGDTQVLVQLFESPARLVIVGGGHIGYALAMIGAQTGFEVAVLDDREDFANEERFAMADDVFAGDLGEGLDAMTFDAATYIVLVSRGHQQDEQALRHAVGRGAAYVGMIGSRRRTRTVLEQLLSDGFEREALEAVHTPIGIDIGAETPEEIAVSILAEIVMERRGGSGERMVERRQTLRDPD
ncbi:MAG TPA: XdhC/CoxI family protein [Dehalococcoidia bacterium]|nr:XdhC/CoxI family protein [Dehalococcoidia bacterium]